LVFEGDVDDHYCFNMKNFPRSFSTVSG